MSSTQTNHGPIADALRARFPDAHVTVAGPLNEVTLEVAPAAWLAAARALRDVFGFEQCVDVCGVDYLGYGDDEWDTDVSSEGFSRGVEGSAVGRFKWGEAPLRQVAQPESEAVEVAKKLGLPLHRIDFINEFILQLRQNCLALLIDSGIALFPDFQIGFIVDAI